MKFVIIFTIVVFVAVTVEAEFQCQQNVPYIENECNGCFCTATHTLGCTQKGCLSERNRELFNCKVGTTYNKKCNTCWCLEGTGTLCTNKKC